MGNSQPKYYRSEKKLADKEVESGENKPPVEKDEATEEELKKVLHLKDSDFLIAENTKNHHTDKYDCTEARENEGFGTEARLVVRRGQAFKVIFHFDRPFSLEFDDLVLIAKCGPLPEVSTVTNGRFEVDESGKLEYKPKEWGARLLKKEGKSATVEIHPPANCAIGRWKLTVGTRSKSKGDKVFFCEDPEEFFILFNPWCEDDQVYMPDEVEKEEYVLNDTGAVFRGHGYRPKGKPWNFGQFEDGILPICLWMVGKCFRGKRYHLFSNPVQVSRAISQVVNCNDWDEGALWGNWSGDYSDGESPSNWFGSVNILKQYWETQESVKYGQCWVFSGVTTTVCRALGIPCLSVTNYSSAHDTTCDGVIDKIYCKNKKGELELCSNLSDSVWNFHVWNEAWMKRPDIPGCKGMYDGWQAIDATPQERSEGVMQCGPAPLKAIKEGHVSIPYDTQFIQAEVNGDEVHAEKISKDCYRKIKVKTDKVGKSLSSKKPDGKKFNPGAWWGNRQDRTECYKYPEGTVENRNAVMRAAINATNRSRYYTGHPEQQDDVEFKLLHEAHLVLGKDIEVKMTAKNVSQYRKTLSDVRFAFKNMKYTGQVGKLIKAYQQRPDEDLKPDQVYEFKCTLRVKDYIDAIDDTRSLCIQAFATVEKTRTRPLQNCIKSHEVVLEEPDIEVKMPGTVGVGQEFEACMEFQNPLDVELTDCTAGFEGRGFKARMGVKQDNVPAGGKGVMKFKMCGKKKGKFNVVFKFHSKQLHYLSGSGEIEVN